MRAFGATDPLSIPDAEQAFSDALASDRFGSLTEIDAAATLQATVGVDLSIARVWPCNVALYETDGHTRVHIVDPRNLIDDSRFKDLVDDAATNRQTTGDDRHEARR
jgi:hypothetical protein